MKIKFIKGHQKGKITERPERNAKLMIRLGLAEEFKEPKKKQEKASIETKEEKSFKETK